MDVQKVQPKRDNGGTWVRLGDKEYLAPPLNFKTLKEMLPIIGSLPRELNGQLPSEDQITAVARVVHASLRRNYPELTLDEIEEEMNMDNFLPIMTGILTASGIKPAEPGKQ